MFSRSAALYDRFYRFKDYAAEAARVAAIIGERAPHARSLLDVACGTGRHTDHLAARFEVEGLDLDEELLGVARERCPGVRFHHGDFREFDLGRRFDAVVCLFSSIGYARTVDGLRRAVRTMASHVAPSGVIVVEPWLPPDGWTVGHVAALFVDDPGLKAARIDVSDRDGDVSILDFHYLVGDATGVRHFTERHELGLFAREQYVEAFELANLAVEHDAEGLIGRGLYVGVPR